ncbi:MAG: 23S rRNA (adenine(2503)-C(2))-methyltransferase RlmN, partial [Lachnospiraceae bacterium]|nr:23S rRNA (adenine(2503)-C(2))-methyltransferase RlmN [Lachnospiraceae bacterium]
MKKDLKSLNLEQLTEELLSIGEKKFRAKQVYSWIHEKLVDSFDEMTNLSKDLREKLKENYTLNSMEVVAVQTSKIDG